MESCSIMKFETMCFGDPSHPCGLNEQLASIQGGGVKLSRHFGRLKGETWRYTPVSDRTTKSVIQLSLGNEKRTTVEEPQQYPKLSDVCDATLAFGLPLGCIAKGMAHGAYGGVYLESVLCRKHQN